MEGMFLLWIILCVIFLAVAYYAAKEFERIAAMKGFVDQKYFWWSFLMPPVGMLMVVALPDRFNAKPAAPVQDEQLPAL